MKVFDCQDMPNLLREKFFTSFAEHKSNDCLVKWTIGDSLDEGDSADEEAVIIKHWR